jgi:hypothetical protein
MDLGAAVQPMISGASLPRIVVVLVVGFCLYLLRRFLSDSQELRKLGKKRHLRDRLIESLACFLMAAVIIVASFAALAFIERSNMPRAKETPRIGPALPGKP